MYDLAVICPDSTWKAVIEAILVRHQALQVRPIDFKVIAGAVGTDAGTRLRAADLARGSLSETRHVLVVFDWAGSGADAAGKRDYVGADVREKLEVDWGTCAEVIVVVPELEAWLVGAHGHFRSLRGLQHVEARSFWQRTGAWPASTDKPEDPKAAIEDLFYLANGLKRSSSNYRKIASAASLSPERCLCPSFKLFVSTLRRWFGQEVA